MSSLQKFHRRTNNAAVVLLPDAIAPIATMGDGSGNDTTGYYLGGFTDGSKMYVAPKSTEIRTSTNTGAGKGYPFGSMGIIRGTTLRNNGVSNTTILAAFGSSITSGHPAAVYCKNMTTGGYNTWYLPAINELRTMYSNRGKKPFATSNSFQTGFYHQSSTEGMAYSPDSNAIAMDLTAGTLRWDAPPSYGGIDKNTGCYIRAIRRSTI